MDNIIINVNSMFRNSSIYPNSHDFSISLEEEIKNIIYIKLTSIELPLFYNSFSDTRNNNTFTVTVGSNTDTVTIGHGCFTEANMVAKIKTRLDEINALRTTTIAITKDVNTGKITFTCGSELIINFARTGNTDYKGIKYHLGFTNDTYTGTGLIGETPLDVNVDRYIFININDIQNIRDNTVNNAFTKIIINSAPFTTLIRGPEEYISKDLVLRSPINLSKLNVKLLDYLGNSLSLGGNNFSFSMELGYVYDEKLYKELNNKGLPNGDHRTKFFY